MTVYCTLCETYCNDNTASHEGGRRHMKAVQQCINSGQPVPPFQQGVQSPNDVAMAQRSEVARQARGASRAPQGIPAHPSQPPNNDPKQIYCPLCNVWSGSMVAHNVHIKGRRHKKAEEGSGAVRHQPQYTSDAQRCEQESYKQQYVSLVLDVMSYIRHTRGLVKAEHNYERDTVSQRVNNRHPEELSAEGYAFFSCTVEEPSSDKKSSEYTFTIGAGNMQSDSMMGTSVYVSPNNATYIDIDKRQVTMLGEVCQVWKDKIVVKNLTGKGKPFVRSSDKLYRIDMGVTTIPTERMCATLYSIKRHHIEKLRLLRIQDKINSQEYFSDEEEDAFQIEGTVSALGILEPFSQFAWCFFHDIQQSVNNTRRMVYNTFQQYSEGHIELQSDLSSGMRARGNNPTAADISEHARGRHSQFDEVCGAYHRAQNTDPLPRFQHNLNESQLEAVAKVVDEARKLTLIQGPPGTGKTTTAVSILAEWVRKYPHMSILASSHSNAGLDNLMDGLIKRGVRCVRVGKSSQPHLAEYSLENYVQNDSSARDRTLLQMKLDELHLRMSSANETGESLSRLGKELKEVSKRLKTTFSKSSAVRSAIREADVICATCISSGSNILTGVNFPFVLIDEATQASEASSLVPICRGSMQVVMIGDQAQLPPTVMNFEAARRGLDVSLFDRLIGSGVEVHMLNTQYRMHPKIAHFSNISFYHSKVMNGVTEDQRTAPPGSLPNDWPVSFTHVAGRENQHGTSKSNRLEAQAVVALLKFVAGKGFSWENIGVITPYSAQVRAIYREVTSVLGPEVRQVLEVKSVDGFQGREKDIVLLSTVRSSAGNLAFVSEWRRINVSLTRARYGLFVVGNVSVLLTSPFWWQWLRTHKQYGMSFGNNTLTMLDPNIASEIETSREPRKRAYVDMHEFGDTLITTHDADAAPTGPPPPPPTYAGDQQRAGMGGVQGVGQAPQSQAAPQGIAPQGFSAPAAQSYPAASTPLPAGRGRGRGQAHSKGGKAAKGAASAAAPAYYGAPPPPPVQQPTTFSPPPAYAAPPPPSEAQVWHRYFPQNP